MSRDEGRSSMSPEERTRRRTAVGKAASDKVAKSEQLNFRIEEQAINELQAMAFSKAMPVGTMIRDWVLERLSQEKLGTRDMTGKALHVLDEIHVKLNGLFSSLASEPPQEDQQLRRASPLHSAVHESLQRYSPASGEPNCYLISLSPAASGPNALPVVASQQSAAMPGPAFSGLGHTPLSEQLDHLKSWEHLLSDQLLAIRCQREEVERSQRR